MYVVIKLSPTTHWREQIIDIRADIQIRAALVLSLWERPKFPNHIFSNKTWDNILH